MLTLDQADPTQFSSASEFLTTFLTLGAPDPALPLPTTQPNFSHSLLGIPDLADTILAWTFTGCVLTMQERSARHRPCAGGWAHPNHFRVADLRRSAPVVSFGALEQRSLAEVCEQMGEQLRLGLRLARAAQLAYWRKDTPHEQQRQAVRGGNLRWQECRHALVGAMEAVLRLYWHLSQRGGWWFAASCLRWQVRVIWAELFGPQVPPPAAVQVWTSPLLISEAQECQGVERLLAERRATGALPAPWEAVAERWEAGDLPEPLRPDAPPRLPALLDGRLRV
jgi:hypothetical protein